ncbi:hypothetical protein SAMN06272755_2218 [Picosynechococcus sp. OG1]|jgi:hypothetical protein|nr:hypothetical protein SAMN06272755_2218 [Picosynechococcus sp. OG1]SMQ81832.1 hypothetical protein SAMN06272774_1494 [Synechococcus sp. 7002]
MDKDKDDGLEAIYGERLLTNCLCVYYLAVMVTVVWALYSEANS